MQKQFIKEEVYSLTTYCEEELTPPAKKSTKPAKSAKGRYKRYLYVTIEYYINNMSVFQENYRLRGNTSRGTDER
jgi:hypothetical protein